MVNVLKAIFQCTPAAALVCVLCSLVYSLCATCSTTFLARMLETAQILSPSILPQMILFAACYLLIQIIRKIFNLIQDISWNVGVEEMCKYRFQMELSEKIGVVPYINFEDEQIHDRIVRARNSVDSMALTQAYTNFLAVAEKVDKQRALH